LCVVEALIFLMALMRALIFLTHVLMR